MNKHLSGDLYSIAISPDEARRQNTLELLVGVDASGLAART